MYAAQETEVLSENLQLAGTKKLLPGSGFNVRNLAGFWESSEHYGTGLGNLAPAFWPQHAPGKFEPCQVTSH